MRRTVRRNTRTLLPRIAGRALTSAVWLLAAATAVNCQCDDVQPPDPPVVHDAPSPVIRVLLTSRPVDQARIATTAGHRIEVDGRVLAESAEPLAPLAVRRSQGQWIVGSLRAAGRDLRVLPGPEGHVRLGDVTYRGHVRLLPAEDSRFRAINHVDIESYLAGVLAKELYRDWHIETYRALAVAARTFATYHVTTFGKSHEYDLGDNQASQVYGGLGGETDRSRRAVADTHGVVLSFGPLGAERIFMAQYSACCGGRVNGAYVIRNANRVAPLEGGQVCNDCSQCSRYRWPTVRVAKTDLLAALAARYASARALGRLVRLEVESRTPYGRAVWVRAVGSTGRNVRIRAEDVRMALLFGGVRAARGLYSMNCDIVDRGGSIEFANGRGFGHGVGLCQWGAQGKALQGWTAERILEAYYPGATLYRIH